MYELPIINPFSIKKIHLIGIGGTGMCGIASVLVQIGYYVTGSDIVKNNVIRNLLKLGVKKIFFGHNYSNIDQAHVVIISSAINSDNPELQAAERAKIPVIKRAVALAELMRYKYSIVIAGTHGKTTTTSMLTNICIESGLCPTFINGGLIKSEGVQARIGYSRYLIAEADESDRSSFLCLHPVVAVVTNIDADHMYTYHHDFKYLVETFVRFLNNLPIYGYGVVCIDDPIINQVLSRINRKIITYGFSKNADVCILNYHQHIEKSHFTILFNNHKKLHFTLNAPGQHNVLNATAAVVVAMKEGIHDANILKAMHDFQGTSRRFENLGNYFLQSINGKSGSIMLIDDYGHHPTELRSTVMTIRMGWPDKRLVMIFQPHRFTRTYDLYYDFVLALSEVDVLLMLDIYAAGEKPILGVDSQSLCTAIYKYGKIKPIFVPNKFSLLKNLYVLLQDNDLLLIQGAGTIGEFVRVSFVNNANYVY